MPARQPVLGELLSSWRERALLTQEQVAERAGLSVRTVRRLETGALRRPRSTTIRLLAQVLNLDDAELAALTSAANGARPGPVPRQLPPDVATFVGRAAELALLEEAGDAATVVVTAIDGMAGIGKSALVVHAAHRLADRFPDGDLFVELHGHSQDGPAAEPSDLLARLLAVLGVPGESIPRHLDDRAALYRSVLAGKKMLIVLDNAADEEQVRPLLPGAGSSLVLVTSRRHLAGLADARTVSLDVLPPPDAVALFSATAGQDRVAGVPPETLAEVVRACGLLPLAIRVAAARLRIHPSWSVGRLLDRLREQELRLSELHGDRVSAALGLSYRELSPAERRAYRLLGLHAGEDVTADAAAALLAAPVARASALLDGLLEVHLLQEPAPGRYRFHDLVRAHAAEAAADEESADDRRAALTRLLDHYGQAASAAMAQLYPGEAAASVPDAGAATTWLEAELPNLLALAHHAAGRHPEHLRHLAATLHPYLRARGRYPEAESLHQRALSAARAAGDRAAEMEALLGLGEIRSVSGRYESAISDATQALKIARDLGHAAGELRALYGLGVSAGSRGQFARAVEYYAQALRIARSIGHRTGELDALIAYGNAHRAMGERERGLDALVTAIGIAQEIGHRMGELRALNGLGRTHLELGDHASAVGCFTRALDLARGTGHRLGELNALTALAALHRARGLHESARSCYRQVLDIAREIGNRNWQFEALHGMGRLHHECGRPGQALDSHRAALDLASRLDQRGDQARAHDGLAHAHAALGRHDRARHHWSRALTILGALGADRTEESGVDVASLRAHLAASEVRLPDGAQAGR